MFKNYFKTAFRNLLRNRIYSFINLTGLTIGLCACMVVATVVIDDLSYDKQWSRADDLYRIITMNKMGDGLYDRFASSFAGLGPALKRNYPEVEASAAMSSSKIRLKLNDADPNGVEVPSLNADTAFWKMLDIKVLSGDPRHYKEGNSNLLVTESFCNKFFPGQDPVGKIIYDVPAYGAQPNSYLITGVIKDLPSNTHLRAQVIYLQKGMTENLSKQQYGTFLQQYVLMKPGTDMEKFSDKVNRWYSGFVKTGNPYQFEFQNIKDVYLHSDFAEKQKVKGNIRNIYILSGVAVLLLIIACINFINLSTARAIHRLQETGVRKILGAVRHQVIFQFLTESVLFFALSFLLAVIIYRLSLKPVEIYLGHPLAQTFFSHISLMAYTFGVILLVSLFTGVYPAWLMSGLNPANALKGKFLISSYGQAWLRKSLVVLQFAISIIVLLAMMVVQRQVRFMEHKNIGFNKNDLLAIGTVSWDGKGNAFKYEILNIAGVRSASLSDWIPADGGGSVSRDIDDPNHPGNKIKVWYIRSDVDLAQTLGLRLQEGRMLSDDYAADVINADSLGWEKYEKSWEIRSSLVTETTAELLHIKSLNIPLKEASTVPVGIVEDFHNESLRYPLGPTFIVAEQSPKYSGMLIRVRPGMEKRIMTSVQQLWKQFYPGKLLDMTWVDDTLNKQYAAETKLQQLFTFFSGLSMFLATLGIFGLIVQATGQRTKEIGIRKVLGASVANITALFSKDLIKLVCVAMIIASPVAWYFMHKWLQSFAYRTNISVWIFLITGGLALFVALITVGFQAIRAAMANPVKSLRAE